jgi:hypothetical protein
LDIYLGVNDLQGPQYGSTSYHHSVVITGARPIVQFRGDDQKWVNGQIHEIRPAGHPKLTRARIINPLSAARYICYTWLSDESWPGTFTVPVRTNGTSNCEAVSAGGSWDIEFDYTVSNSTTDGFPAYRTLQVYTFQDPGLYVHASIRTTTGAIPNQEGVRFGAWDTRTSRVGDSNGIPLMLYQTDAVGGGNHDLNPRLTWQFVSVSTCKTSADASLDSVSAFASTYKGHHYVIGDEPDVEIYPNCQHLTAQEYATKYKTITDSIAHIDPSAKFSPAAISVLGWTTYANAFLNAYAGLGNTRPLQELRFNIQDQTYTNFTQLADAAASFAAGKGLPVFLGIGFPQTASDQSALVANMVSYVKNLQNSRGALWFMYGPHLNPSFNFYNLLADGNNQPTTVGQNFKAAAGL